MFLRDHDDTNRVDVERRTLYLSPIFDWYRGNVPAEREAFGQYLATFLRGGPKRAVLEGGGASDVLDRLLRGC